MSIRHSSNLLSGIFISPPKGRYNYTGTPSIWPQRALYEVVFLFGIVKMPISADFFTLSMLHHLVWLNVFHALPNIPTTRAFVRSQVKLDTNTTGSRYRRNQVSLVTVICDHTIYIAAENVNAMIYTACDKEMLNIIGLFCFSFVFCRSSSV